MTNALTPERIKLAWSKVAPSHDGVLRWKEAADLLREPGRDPNSYTSLFTALRARQQDEPNFFEQHRYDWAAEHSAYDFPIEAAYQVRTLDAAIGLWKSPYVGRVHAANFENVVARTTSFSRFTRASPFAQQSDDISFLVCPLGWAEFLSWLFAGLSADFGVDDATRRSASATWERVLTGARASGRDVARRHWVTIVANLVASRSCIHDLVMPQATASIRDDVPAFREAIVGLEGCAESPMSADLAYLAVEMSIAHELGHIVRGDHRPPYAADELSADFVGMIAFENSWGWRHWCLDGSGLSDIGRIALGSLAFSNGLLALAGADLHVARCRKIEGWRHEHLTATMTRGTRTALHVDEYLQQVLGTSRAWPESEGDKAILEPLILKMGQYVVDFIEFVKSITPESINDATRVAAAIQLHE